MLWIKRNLFFVILVVVGLLLTGYCGYLLAGALHDNASAKDDYDSSSSNLKSLQSKNPLPSKENIDAVLADENRVRGFLTDFNKRFAPFPTPPSEDARGFGTYLDNTLVQFRSGATNVGVQLPQPDYAFAFSSLIGQPSPHAEDIGPWMQQLEEIKAILDILYGAKVNSLESLQRAPVGPDDGGPDCVLTAPPPTPSWTVTPYKISFRGFSEELAAVLDGFAKSSNCFIVKTVDVMEDRSSTPTTSQPAQPIPDQRGMLMPRFTPPSAFSPREFPQARPAATPATAPATPTAAEAYGPPKTILYENPLVVTMLVDVVKLKPLDELKAAPTTLMPKRLEH